MNILGNLTERKQKGIKSLAVLIDPDKVEDDNSLTMMIRMCMENMVDYFLVGGSFITKNTSSHIITKIKELCDIPVVLFPGSNLHIDLSADSILFLSLISGRNPDYLIGQHVLAAPILKNSTLEIIPTGYVLIGENNATTVSYISNTIPIPADKYSIAACTALAGEMLGLKIIYLDAGSGAENHISPKMISSVKKSISIPLMVGGGLNSLVKVSEALEAGAETVVVGNGIENNPELLIEISDYIRELNAPLKIH